MAEVKGRAGFHLTHTKAVSERAAILHECMREIVPGAVDYWAERNPNIVREDERLDLAYVNDGSGSFRRAKSISEVLAYGQSRIDHLAKPLPKVTTDARTGKTKGREVFTTSMFVVHLPKSLCKRVPGYYPVLDEKGKPALDGSGKPLRRDRWVARDRAEAVKYFTDALFFLGNDVVPGGVDAILGADLQFSESTPHMQVVADTFAPDERNEGKLVPSFSRAYGSHRDVVDAKTGKRLSGRKKMANYHAAFKEAMVERGWDIEATPDEHRRLVGLSKDEYVASQEALRVAEGLTEAAETSVKRARSRERVAVDAEAKAEAARAAADAERAAAEAARAAAETERVALQQAQERARVLSAELEAVLAEARAIPQVQRKRAADLLRQFTAETQRTKPLTRPKPAPRRSVGGFLDDPAPVHSYLVNDDEAEAEADFEL